MKNILALILIVLLELSCSAQHVDTLQFTYRGNTPIGWKITEDTLFVHTDTAIVLKSDIFISVFVDESGDVHDPMLSSIVLSSDNSSCIYEYYYDMSGEPFSPQSCSENSLLYSYIKSHQKEILDLYRQHIANTQFIVVGYAPPNLYTIYQLCHLYFLPIQ